MNNRIRHIRHMMVLLLYSSSMMLCVGANPPSPVAHFTFDGHFSDVSIHQNHGIAKGDIEFVEDRFSNPCGAAFFNGRDAYVEVPDSRSLQAPIYEFTLTAWYNLGPPASDGLQWLTLVCKGDLSQETSRNPQYRVQVMQSPLQSTISINSEITEYDQRFRTHLFQNGAWHFYAMVYNGMEIVVYMDGEETWRFPYRKALIANRSPLHIARDVPGNNEFFHGALDDLIIYDRALSPVEVRHNYNANAGADSQEEFKLICPQNIRVELTDTGCDRIVNYPLPEIENFCQNSVNLTRVLGPPSGTAFLHGTSRVAYTARSASGKTKSCSFTVQVFDRYPPLVYCSSDTTIYVGSTEDFAVYEYAPCKLAPSCMPIRLDRIHGPESGARFPLGMSDIVFQAHKENGQTAESSFTVTVLRRSVEPELMVELPEGETEVRVADKEEVDYVYDLTMNSCYITIEIFDNWEQDFDTVSIFFNDQVIIDRQMIRLRKNGSIVKVIALNPGVENTIVAKAWNMGNVGKNTLQINFYHGDLTPSIKKLHRKKPFQTKILHSEPGLSAGIRIKCSS